MDVKEIISEISKPHPCLHCGKTVTGMGGLCEKCFINARIGQPMTRHEAEQIRRKLAEAKKEE